MLAAATIKASARAIGFDVCGIASAAEHPELAFFADWLARGYAGDMAYLSRSAEARADIRRVLPGARTVIVTGTVYNTDRPYSIERADPHQARISRYAWGEDYHRIIGERLDRLLTWMRDASDEPFEARAYVDTGPIQERVFAQHAGIGWIGKNTCVINPELGSWLFLGEIVCTLALELDTPAFDRCGTCALCIEACPTQAIRDAGVLDATRCISYLTIEHRGDIPEEWRTRIGSHVYGCDLCQDVCPWNGTSPRSSDPAWQPRPAWDGPTLDQLDAMPDLELQRSLKGSAMKRAKISGLRRNVRNACANAAGTGQS